MWRNSSKPIPGTNGEMTERDLYNLLKHLSENVILIVLVVYLFQKEASIH